MSGNRQVHLMLVFMNCLSVCLYADIYGLSVSLYAGIYGLSVCLSVYLYAGIYELSVCLSVPRLSCGVSVPT